MGEPGAEATEPVVDFRVAAEEELPGGAGDLTLVVFPGEEVGNEGDEQDEGEKEQGEAADVAEGVAAEQGAEIGDFELPAAGFGLFFFGLIGFFGLVAH